MLVRATVHDDAGRPRKVIDPKGTEQRTEYDAAGWQTKVIDNYVDGNPATGDPDEDRTTQYTYTADGEIATITAVNSETGDQTTTYHYGTTLTDSAVARADLLRQVEYPDSTGSTDRVTNRYNRLGEVVERKDQAGTITGPEAQRAPRAEGRQSPLCAPDREAASRGVCAGAASEDGGYGGWRGRVGGIAAAAGDRAG